MPYAKVLRGSTAIGRVYKGATQVWSASAPTITHTFLNALTPKTNQAASFTWSSQSFGAADANRWLIVTINYRGLSDEDTISTITVGGVNATLVKVQHNSGEGAAIAAAKVPTGTSGDIVVTSTGGLRRLGGGVIRAIGLRSAIADDTAGVNGNTGDDPSVTIDKYAGGLVVGTQWYSSESLDQRSAGASIATATGQLGATITVTNTEQSSDWSGITKDYDQLVITSSSTDQAAAFASWSANAPV